MRRSPFRTAALAVAVLTLSPNLPAAAEEPTPASAPTATLAQAAPKAPLKASQNIVELKLGYATFSKHCTGCHVSVADPERPGKTRDEWYRVVRLMKEHGLRLSEEESDQIVDLLFALRRGMEKDPG